METVVGWYGSIALGIATTAAAIAVAHFAANSRFAGAAERLESVLQTRPVAVAIGIATAAIVWWCWGSIRQVPVSQDERAYLLQANIFASAHWTAPSPPLPQFFEQMHVLVYPIVASKYPPGHSLLLAVGAWLGLDGLTPLVLSAIAGASLFIVSRKLAGPWVALMTWVIWVTERANILRRASYYSEITTAALWLVGWWALLEWRTHHRWWAISCLGACVGWGAITRPLTMLVFAVPAATIVLADLYRRHAWATIAPGLAAGAMCLAIVPVWSAHTTGNWRVTPLTQYTHEYIPWDHLGFGYDSTPPERTLPVDLHSLADGFIEMHKAYSASAVAPTLVARTGYIAGEFFEGWRCILAVFFIIGLLETTSAVAFGLTTASLLILAYLPYAHPPTWTLYYLELLPVPAFIAARGVWKCVSRDQPAATRLAVVLLLITGAAFSTSGLRDARNARSGTTQYAQRFRRQLEELDSGKVLIFVRYSPRHFVHYSLVGNVPDVHGAPALIAYDRGAENRRLIALTPGRSAYAYTEETQVFTRLTDSAEAPAASPSQLPISAKVGLRR